MDPGIDKKPIYRASRPSGLKIEKYLMPNEVIAYSTRKTVYVDGDEGLKGFVTDRRVLFFASKGLFSKSDRLYEISFKRIYSFATIEVGSVIKRIHLQLNDFKISGDRTDIFGLYGAIQTAKQSSR